MVQKALCILAASMLILNLQKLSCQETGSSSRRAERFYQLALKEYQLMNYEQALQQTHKALKIDNRFVRAFLLAGDINLELGNKYAAISDYENAILIQPDYYPPAHYILGNLYLGTGQYEKAIKRFSRYLEYNLPGAERSLTRERKETAAYAHSLKSNPVPFNPVNLCDHINTPNNEYVNAVSADGEMLIFTVRRPVEEAGRQRFFREEFYVSHLENNQWSVAEPMKFLSTDSESEGALALSYDNNLIFFTSCHRSDGFGSCDLYYSIKQGEKWSDPINLGPVVNSPRWESQPSLSSDGKTLYFASNRPGGFGGSDIWKTVLQADGSWGRPVNLGNEINTAGDEMAPYIHADGQTLYFSSTGHPGLGGADLFVSRMQPDGHWTSPLNLGYPINTHADEINLIVHPDGKSAFISSDLPDGKGGYDIYTFDLYDEIKPLPVSYVKGTVRHALTYKPLEAKVELTDLENGMMIVSSRSDPVNGEFLAVLPAGSRYALYAHRKNFIFSSFHFALDSITGIFDPVLLDILLKPVETGQSGVLRNVFFAHDSYFLESESLVELNRLRSFLAENPEVALEISGHTDNTGSYTYNIELSTRRARAVYEFLLSEGIDINRLTYIGFADKHPVDTNKTPEGRARNRRTEFKIINRKGQ